MGLFSNKSKMISCPICNASFDQSLRSSHWEIHITKIPEGQGEASGQYTWECACGPSGMKWERDGAAKSGLMLHMRDRHSIPL